MLHVFFCDIHAFWHVESVPKIKPHTAIVIGCMYCLAVVLAAYTNQRFVIICEYREVFTSGWEEIRPCQFYGEPYVRIESYHPSE